MYYDEEYVPEEWAEIQCLEDEMVAQMDAAWIRYNKAMEDGDDAAVEMAVMDYCKAENDLYLSGLKYDPCTKELECLETDEEVFGWSPFLK